MIACVMYVILFNSPPNSHFSKDTEQQNWWSRCRKQRKLIIDWLKLAHTDTTRV